MHNNIAIKAENLYKSFGNGDSLIEVIKDASFTINKGELVALVAPSGGGKTTLLMMIGCVTEPSAGKIWIGNEKVFENKWLTKETRKIRREKIGFIFQAHYLIPFLNILDNLTLLPQANNTDEKTSKAKARELLLYFDIADKEKAMPAQLSGGQNQRVAIARALVTEPGIILSDEPTANLDSKTGDEILDLMQSLNEERKVTLVYATHDASIVSRAKRIVNILDGRVVDDKNLR